MRGKNRDRHRNLDENPRLASAFRGAMDDPCRVTVVVTVPGQEEPWKVSNSAFRLLVAEVEGLTSDSSFMERAAALNGLHLGSEADPERDRIAGLIATAARTLRAQLMSNPEATEWELSLANSLPVLEMWMDGLVDKSK